MKPTIKLVLKGILLYTTTLITLIYVCSIDSLFDFSTFGLTTLVVAALIFLCIRHISGDEFMKLTFNKIK